MTKTLAEMGFAFSSDSNEWYTPPEVIKFCEMLAKRFTVDLCGLSPYFEHKPKFHGVESDGLLSFLRWRFMIGASVFCNPPYGHLHAQTLNLEENNVRTEDLKYLPVLPGKLTSIYKDADLTFVRADSPAKKLESPSWRLGDQGFHKMFDGENHLPVKSNVHSAHSYALYLLNLWNAGIIRQAVLVIPNATDTLGYNQLLREVGFCFNVVGRVKFLSPKDGKLVPGSQNTKGTTIFWLPPHGEINRPQDLTAKVAMMMAECGGKLPIDVAPMWYL